MADTRVKDVAHTILSFLEDELAMAGIDVPARSYVSAGEVSHDFGGSNCADQLAVSWTGNFQGLPGQDNTNAPLRCAVPVTATFAIALLRCVPTLDTRGNPPSPTQLSDSGNQIMTDGMTLARVIIDGHLEESILETGCTLLALGAIEPYGPQGGVGGSVVGLMVSLV